VVAFNEWKEQLLSHLKAEDEILCPLTADYAMKIGDATEIGKIISEQVLTPYSEELPAFAGFCSKMLSYHGTMERDRFTSLLYFVIDLQRSCTSTQWEAVLVEVKKSISSTYREKLEMEYELDRRGVQGNSGLIGKQPQLDRAHDAALERSERRLKQ